MFYIRANVSMPCLLYCMLIVFKNILVLVQITCLGLLGIQLTLLRVYGYGFWFVLHFIVILAITTIASSIIMVKVWDIKCIMHGVFY